MSAPVIALIHFIVAVAVLGCLIGFSVITWSEGGTFLGVILGAGAGSALTLLNPNSGSKLP